MNAAAKHEAPLAVAKWIDQTLLERLTGWATKEAVKAYRARGVWLEGVHWIKNPVGRVVYNLEAVERWCEGEL